MNNTINNNKNNKDIHPKNINEIIIYTFLKLFKNNNKHTDNK